ncbi:hypothetical protein RHSIM_Rhsim08G0251500 [Rhododendron simsii]|uniref:Transcription termination factor MTERF2, chloroplastic n=1 Tax=Rhododendron simsii TaxID=118357 RepID=A0A834GJQ6_RHOSS|nr:hypothetical protein RHSIM_Rhsim08G0251500 [Rhododendron simsii]
MTTPTPTRILPPPPCYYATYNSPRAPPNNNSGSYYNIGTCSNLSVVPPSSSKINLALWYKSSCSPPKINILLCCCNHNNHLPPLPLEPNGVDSQDSCTLKQEEEEEEEATAAAREAISEILQEFGASKEDSIDIALRSPKYLAMLLDSVRELDDLSLWDSLTRRTGSQEEESSPLSLKDKVYYMAKEKADKGKIPFLESLGLGLPSATHLARRLSSQTLPNLITKVKYVKEMFFSNSDDGGLIGKKARRMMMYLSIPIDEEVEQTLSFFEKVEARRGGLDMLGSRDATFRYLIESFPRLLLLSLEYHMKPMVNFLESIGVPRGCSRSILIVFPPILFSDIEKDIKPSIQAFKKVGAGIEDFAGMLLNYPWILSRSIQENYEEIRFFFEREKVPKVSVDLAIKSWPLLLGCSVSKLKVMVEQFGELGVRNKKLGRVITRSPQLLLRKPQEVLQVVSFLKDLGHEEETIGSLIGRRPDIFAASIEKTLKKKLDFLATVGVSESHLPRVIRKYPGLFVCAVDRAMLPRMKYLLEIGLSERDVAFMVRRFSPLLGYDIDTVLRPKVEFLVNVMGKPLKNVVEYPRYFSYSLKKKIKPRYWLLKRRKVECSLKDMLGKNDEEFSSEFLDVERMLASPYLEKVADMLCKNDGGCRYVLGLKE